MKKIFSVLVMTVLWTSSASANLVQNGSFESPVAATGSYWAGMPTGWSDLGNGSNVDIISSGYSGGSASDGVQFVDLIGGGVGTLPSGLKQTVHLTAGSTYVLSFDYNGDGMSTPGSVLEYSLGNLVSGSINVDTLNIFTNFGSVTPWQKLSSNIQVTQTGDYVLQFQASSGSWGGPYIDNVVLDSASVPEPSTLLLLGSGLVGLLGMRRRFKA